MTVARVVTFEADRFRCTVPAEAPELATVRGAVRGWLVERVADPAVVDDVVIGVGEACANVVEHAYPEEPRGAMAVDVWRDRTGDVVVQVRDWGSWHRPGADGAGARVGRGRGTGMMRAVAGEFTRVVGPDGTVVTMRVRGTRRGADGQGRT